MYRTGRASSCSSSRSQVRQLTALQQIGHRFETFLMTLYREVQKRSILQAPAPAEEGASAPGGTRPA